MAIETFQRQEIKFLLNEVQYQALTEQLEQYMNPDPYCVGGKDYGIYNIYYDTPDDYLIRTSLAKPYYKEKIRLRSYMSPAKPEDLVFLEIKKKIGGIVNKRRITLTLKKRKRICNVAFIWWTMGNMSGGWCWRSLTISVVVTHRLYQSSISAISERHFSERMTQISG